MTSDGRLAVDGANGIGSIGRYTLLARFREHEMKRGRQLVVEGVLRQGGLSVGWLSKGAWASQLTITEPGPVVAAFEAPADGNYSFVIANNLRGSTLRNVCEFTRMALLP